MTLRYEDGLVAASFVAGKARGVSTTVLAPSPFFASS